MLSLSKHCTAVVLAAGTGSRFGGQKLLANVNGKPMIARVLAAVAHLPTVVVGSPELRAHVGDATFVENAAPERGMSYSLRLADERVDRSHGLLVMLADMPFMTRAIVDTIVNGVDDADVCYPQRAGIGGHPVFFSSQARTKIAALPDGDTLRALRDDPALTHLVIDIADDGAYRDIDRACDLGAPTTGTSYRPEPGQT
jgi:molybdenum cofactor cytidylyltransferase